jgi:hypothetical protein
MTPLYLLVGSVFIDHVIQRVCARRTTQLRAHA